MPKLLYLSCHSIAEYMEVKMFRELGLEVFPHGCYANGKGDGARPELETCGQEFIDSLEKNPKEKMSREFLDQFDIVLSHWMPGWISLNWENMKDKLVIMRTNGQSTRGNELEMKPYKEKGMKIVRYSPTEQRIPDYCGHDAIVRFGLDPEEFKGYNGQVKQIITVAQSMQSRGEYCGYEIFRNVTKGLPVRLYGRGNEQSDDWGGFLNYDNLKRAYQNSRVYFYTGTWPTAYVLNFIEAWMTGIPIVAIGKEKGNVNGKALPFQDTYEIPELVEHGVTGFVSDCEDMLRSYCQLMLTNQAAAKKVGEAGRKKAIEIFGINKIREEWRSFFQQEGVL